ncbi:hypothetical protein DFH07DRAFT_752848 [Mycena maculata]|uniref:Uncharacterized protein n=1 Tax=Mycena maculata TaxID=230809 RepID=A0AAD7I9N7_9AGAR|nr:hypothetical protein DFH07DRAFT_752848 [Mycena maculata]
MTFPALDPSVICSGFTNDGQNPPVAGQTASSTSTNNYINFCALTLPDTPLTNGAQITTGSCNPTPIGLIPAVDQMPSAKFTFPQNFATIAANTPFNLTMAIQNMQTGIFTNAALTYFAAPQTLNPSGQIIGHSHFVVESLTSLDQTTPNDPEKFVFFKGIDNAAVNGVLSATVAAGLPAGVYRVCSINSASNHQPVIVPIAQHGSLDDCSYFTAVDGGAAATGANSTASATGAANSTAIATGANSTAVATGAANSTEAASAVASAVATGKAAKGKGGKAAASSAVVASASAVAAAPAVSASASAPAVAAAASASAAPAVAAAASASAAPAAAAAANASAAPAVAASASAAPAVAASASSGKSSGKGKN